MAGDFPQREGTRADVDSEQTLADSGTPYGDLDLKRDRPFTVFARRVSGTGGTLNAFMENWEESW